MHDNRSEAATPGFEFLFEGVPAVDIGLPAINSNPPKKQQHKNTPSNNKINNTGLIYYRTLLFDGRGEKLLLNLTVFGKARDPHRGIKTLSRDNESVRAQELCQSRGGRPGLPSLRPVLNWANVCLPNILRTVRRTMIRFLIELLVRRTWFGQFDELCFVLSWLVMRCKLQPDLAADAQQTA